MPNGRSSKGPGWPATYEGLSGDSLVEVSMSKPQKPAHARTIRRRKRAAEPEATSVPTEPQDATSPPQKATNTRVSKASATPPAETPTETLDGSALLAEIEAMGADAFAALMAGGSPDKLEAGDQVEGSVVRVTDDTVFVNIGAKAEGFMERAEFEGNAPAIGAQITAFVVQLVRTFNSHASER